MPIDEDKLENIQNLFTSTNRLFLMGAGCSFCANLPLMTDLTKNVLGNAQGKTKEILDAINSEVNGNIEDILSQLGNYITVASKRNTHDTDIQIASLSFTKEQPVDALHEAKSLIAENITSTSISKTHLGFVKAVHRTQRPGRATNVSSIHYFILNFDTLIEDALGYEGVSYTDGMEGGATAY